MVNARSSAVNELQLFRKMLLINKKKHKKRIWMLCIKMDVYSWNTVRKMFIKVRKLVDYTSL